MKLIIDHFNQNAHAMLRFGRGIEILGIYDGRAKLQGRDAGEALGMGKTGIKISGDFKKLLRGTDAEMFVATGEGFYFTKPGNTEEWRRHIKLAMAGGLDIYSMSKTLYGKGTEDLKETARKKGVRFLEASDPDGWEGFMPFAERAVEKGLSIPRVNFTGTSMNSGKVTAMFTVKKTLEDRGLRVGVVGTEPSSLFLGADEQVIPEIYPTMKGAPSILGAVRKIEEEKRPDIVLVGNQTGLRAPATDLRESRAGAIVAWQVLLGSKPGRIVLCSKWKNTGEIGPHLELIKSSGINAPVIANVINGFRCNKEKLMEIISRTEREFRIPCLDVISSPERLGALAELIMQE